MGIQNIYPCRKFVHQNEISPLVRILLNFDTNIRGDGAGPAGTAAAGPMLEAKLMNLIKGWLQKF